MYLEIIILSEVNQTEKSKALYHNTYMWNLKMMQINLFTKQKQTHGHRKNNVMVTKEERTGVGCINKSWRLADTHCYT